MSDLHVDINERYPLELKDKDVFTVICGDMGGETEMGIDWIRKNVRRGIIVNGNHMPYRNTYERPVKDYKTMTEFREWLRAEFPIGGDISYLDAEIGDFKKEVDGILFMGSCFYSNFRIKEPTWNPSGDKRLNMKCSEYNMNDYRFGYTGRSFPAGADNEPSMKRMTAEDLEGWFSNAFSKFDKALDENEASANPKPVVVVTHYPLVADYLSHNYYVKSPNSIYSQLEFNWSSYASDAKAWLKRHKSIKAACSGHIHDVENGYRYYSVRRKGGDDLLLVHNVRGYVSEGHDRWFNAETFVDTKTWTCFETPPTEEEEKTKKEEAGGRLARRLAWGI